MSLETQVQRGDSIHHVSDNLTGVVLSMTEDLITVMTTDGNKEWKASDCEIIHEYD